MKKIGTLLILLLSVTTLIAQEKGIVVNYSQQIKFDLEKAKEEIANSQNKRVQSMVNSALAGVSKNTYPFQLITTVNSSTYNRIEKIDNRQNEGTVTLSLGGESTPKYIDLNNKIYYQKVKNFDEEYEIKDSLTHYDWKITREAKKVLGFDCRKATAKDGKKDIIAWYAPKLPYKSGPDGITGLPGLILELTIKSNNKKQRVAHLWATDVQIKENINIKFPEFENPITQKDFQIKREEMFKKFKEMQSQGVEKD
ncbi:GLPGLI family protein [Weeksellaceae bacterium TAE3-ERU29]|nr:GLPGLI family protein [Weeksellaceae bacterium TAE3-ERU29]